MSSLSLREEFYFMSNSYPVTMVHEGIRYENCECAYQSSKYDKHMDKLTMCGLGFERGRRVGKSIPTPPDWSHVRVAAMMDSVMSKFMDSAMAYRLLSTGDAKLVEEDVYAGGFWGSCGGKGSNALGVILMEVREGLKELEATNMDSHDPFKPQVYDLPYRPRISRAILSHAMEGWDVSLNYDSNIRPLVLLGSWGLRDGTTASVCTYSPELVSLGLTFDNWDSQYTAGLVKDMYLDLIGKGVRNVSMPGVIRKPPLGSQAMGKAIQLMYDELAGGVSLIHHCSISKMLLLLVLREATGRLFVYRFTAETNVLLCQHFTGSWMSPSDVLSAYTDEGPRSFSRITVSRMGFVQFTGRERFSSRLFSRLRRSIEGMMTGHTLSEVLETMERVH